MLAHRRGGHGRQPAQLLHRAVRANGAKLQWSYSAPPADNMTNATNRANFLATVRDAVTACDVDGMEFDCEQQQPHELGSPTPGVLSAC